MLRELTVRDNIKVSGLLIEVVLWIHYTLTHRPR
jgi:hypothetical protein